MCMQAIFALENYNIYTLISSLFWISFAACKLLRIVALDVPYLPVLVIIISVPSSLNLSHNSLVSR